MENHKKRKNLVCRSTTDAAACTTDAAACTTTTVCAPESSAPVAKRRKQHSVDKDLSSASHAPLAKRRRYKRYRRSSARWNQPFPMYGTRSDRRRTASIFCGTLDLTSGVLRYHIRAGVGLKKRQVISFEAPWVALQGKTSICLVARRKDMLRLTEGVNWKNFCRNFWNAIISEIEGKSRKKPFGVVSVMKQDSNKVRKASRAKYDAEKAIKFLWEEMESGTVFTFKKTIQTAISAFQYLFGKEFEADEIRVFAIKDNQSIEKELKQRRKDIDIKEILAIINGAGA